MFVTKALSLACSKKLRQIIFVVVIDFHSHSDNIFVLSAHICKFRDGLTILFSSVAN